MYRCLVLVLLIGLVFSVSAPANVQAEDVSASASGSIDPGSMSGVSLLAQNLHRRGGAYLSWWKLLCIAIPFLLWVAIVDWMNKDAIRFVDCL